MHEATLMKGLMRRIEEIARDQEAVRVVGVSVWLGALSHMSPGHFAEHFEEAVRGHHRRGRQTQRHRLRRRSPRQRPGRPLGEYRGGDLRSRDA